MCSSQPTVAAASGSNHACAVDNSGGDADGHSSLERRRWDDSVSATAGQRQAPLEGAFSSVLREKQALRDWRDIPGGGNSMTKDTEG